MRWTEGKGALSICAMRIKLNLLMNLKNTSQRLDISLFVGTMLEGEVRNDVRKLERYAFVLHVLDGEKHLRHDILARAGVGGLRINDFRIVLVAPRVVGGRGCGC